MKEYTYFTILDDKGRNRIFSDLPESTKCPRSFIYSQSKMVEMMFFQVGSCSSFLFIFLSIIVPLHRRNRRSTKNVTSCQLVYSTTKPEKQRQVTDAFSLWAAATTAVAATATVSAGLRFFVYLLSFLLIVVARGRAARLSFDRCHAPIFSRRAEARFPIGALGFRCQRRLLPLKRPFTCYDRQVKPNPEILLAAEVMRV